MPWAGTGLVRRTFTIDFVRCRLSRTYIFRQQETNPAMKVRSLAQLFPNVAHTLRQSFLRVMMDTVQKSPNVSYGQLRTRTC